MTLCRCLRNIASSNVFGLVAIPLAVGMMVFLKSQGAPLQPPGIVCLELAFTDGRAAEIVSGWAGKLDVAVKQVKFDFIFIVGYAGSLLFIGLKAADFAQYRGRGDLTPAAEIAGLGGLLAGVLDCIENAGLLAMLSGTISSPIALVTSVCAATKFALGTVAFVVAIAVASWSWFKPAQP